jgi:hypothetical protein
MEAVEEGAMIDIQNIGETAGVVWQYLQEHDRATLTTLTRAVGAHSDIILMAVGWLAREGKLAFTQEARSVYVQLIDR